MNAATSLEALKDSFSKSFKLVRNSSVTDSGGQSILDAEDRGQIITAAFLNSFIAWENYLQDIMILFLMGNPTISGSLPNRYALPDSAKRARGMVSGTQRYFDYGNHDFVSTIARLFFEDGYPFLEPMNSIWIELADIKTIRNSAAHISENTQSQLDALATRVLGKSVADILISDFLLKMHPKRATDTVFSYYLDILLAAGTRIANG